MNKLIRASVIASALTVAGIVANTTNAFAADQLVNFQGTVLPTCTFSNVVDGALGQEVASPEFLSEIGTGGAPGYVDLACNSGAQVSVGLPVDNGSSVPISPSFEGASAVTSAGIAKQDSISATPISIPGPVRETLQVGMYVRNGITPIPVGTYNYNVTVTATPQ